jgi:hypothetical protein
MEIKAEKGKGNLFIICEQYSLKESNPEFTRKLHRPDSHQYSE